MSDPDGTEVAALIDADVAVQLQQQADLIAELTAQRDELLRDDPEDPHDNEDDEDAQPEPIYTDVAAFVTGWLAPRSERLPAWCDSWWLHPLALTRLRALWQSWEVANAEGGLAMSKWLIYDYDHHITKLTTKGGPFHECHNGQHRTGANTITPVPEGTELPPEPL
jgi:hypothetical protein